MRMLPSGKLVFTGCWSGLGLLLHYYSFGVYGDFLEARNYFRCASFLISAPKVLAKKLFRFHKQRHVIHGAGEAVTFIGCKQVLDGEAAVTQGDDYLLSLSTVDAGIIGTLRDE